MQIHKIPKKDRWVSKKFGPKKRKVKFKRLTKVQRRKVELAKNFGVLNAPSYVWDVGDVSDVSYLNVDVDSASLR